MHTNIKHENRKNQKIFEAEKLSSENSGLQSLVIERAVASRIFMMNLKFSDT